MSAPLFSTPCASSVPVGRRTVEIFCGTHSRNSIQLISAISRVDGCCAYSSGAKRKGSNLLETVMVACHCAQTLKEEARRRLSVEQALTQGSQAVLHAGVKTGCLGSVCIAPRLRQQSG